MPTGDVITRLRTDLDGRVVTPEDSGYDKARQVLDPSVDRRPVAVTRPETTAEVAGVVRLAREAGLELAVRSGGHSGAGHGVTDGGIVVDLSRMRGLDIDVAGRTAWAQTGLTAGQYTAAAAEHGLATGFGDTGTVGIGGITLGGGVGFLTRKYGMTIDHLLAAEVVTADGEVLQVDVDHHPDLFWALRGGGGNFGVATRFRYRLNQVPGVVGGILILPATAEVVRGFVALAKAAPEELSTIANVMNAPPMPFLPPEVHGKLVVMGLVCYSGPAEAAEPVLAPFRALADPLADMVRPIAYPEMFPPHDPDYRPTAAARTLYIDTVDEQVAATVMRYIESSDAPMRAAQIRVLGGAAARVPADATAYAHRDRELMVNVAAFYTSPEEQPVRQQWVDEFAGAIGPVGAAYVNFLGHDGPGRLLEAYPEPTLTRLREVKRRYDPSNVFHMNVNIPPA